MSELVETIERVVREVLAQMGHEVTCAPGAPPAHSADAADASNAPPPFPADSLLLNRRVVTLADLPERLGPVRRLVVPYGAVLTPAVRDLLQQQQIAVVFGQPDVPAAQSVRTVLAVAATQYDARPLESALRREGYEVELRHSDCLIQAIDQVAEAVGTGTTMAIVATEHPAAALCLANRHSGVRAILGVRPDRVAAEAQSVGANVLVVDPTTNGFFVLKQMAMQFLRGGLKPCPKVFQKRLA